MMTTLLAITNQYGAKLTTCEEHKAAALKHFSGTLTETPTTTGVCRRCEEDAAWKSLPARFIAAVNAPDFAYTRQGSKASPWSDEVYVYRREPKSPSGVMLVTSLDQTRYRELLASGQLRGLAASPLSPTEGR